MKENIALIGFMGSGKSTVGKNLARSLEMKFIDIDKEIVKIEQRSIESIFNLNGEEYFRKLERNIIEAESKDNNIVIATGGGVIIDNHNIKKLKVFKNTYFHFLASPRSNILLNIKFIND